MRSGVIWALGETKDDLASIGQTQGFSSFSQPTMIGMEARSFARSGSTVVAEVLLDGPGKEAGGRQMIAENSEGFSAPITT